MNKWLSNVNFVRVIALLVGIMLFVVVHMDQNIETTSNQPVIIESTFYNILLTPEFDQENYYIASVEPSTVQFVATGRESTVNKLRTNENYKITFDVSNFKPGEYEVDLEKKGFPSGLNIEISPSKVRVKLEKLQTKELPVQLIVNGNPAENYVITGTAIKPTKVTVKAPASIIGQVSSVRGEISVEKADKDVKQKVVVYAYNSAGRVLDAWITPNEVEVTTSIQKENASLPLDFLLNGQLATGYAIESMTLTPPQVNINGNFQVISQLSKYPGGTIDISGLSENKQFTIDLPLLSGISKVEPTSAQVQVNVVQASTIDLNEIPIQITGITNELTAQIELPQEQTLNLTLEGAPSVLNSLQNENVQVTIDVTSLEVGSHDVEISLSLPPFVKVIDQSFSKVKVNISQKTN